MKNNPYQVMTAPILLLVLKAGTGVRCYGQLCLFFGLPQGSGT